MMRRFMVSGGPVYDSWGVLLGVCGLARNGAQFHEPVWGCKYGLALCTLASLAILAPCTHTSPNMMCSLLDDFDTYTVMNQQWYTSLVLP